MVAPGPGDTSEDDDMDFDQVEKCQDLMNGRIEVYYKMAKAGEMLEVETLDAVPYT